MEFKEIKSKLKKTKYYNLYKSLKSKNLSKISFSKIKNRLTFDYSKGNILKKEKRDQLTKFFDKMPKTSNIIKISNIINLQELKKLKDKIKNNSLISKKLSNQFLEKIKFKSFINDLYSSKINTLKKNSSFIFQKLNSKSNSINSTSKNKSKSRKTNLSFNSISSIFKKYNFDSLKPFYNRFVPKDKNSTVKLSEDYFLVIHFSDHVLTVSKILSENNLNKIDQVVNINIPTSIIGDYKVENKEELRNIIQDIIGLFEIANKPIILLLSSGFFTIKSFDDGELVVFSENNPKLLSKSPFLPDDTLIQYSRVSGNKLSSYHRVVYINKTILDTWIEVISQLESPIAGVTCSSAHLVEELTNKYGGLTVLCDIELSYVTVYIEKENCELNTIKLPFGTSIYISEDSELALQFFQRLEKSIFSILKKFNYKKPKSIYLIGQGFDKLNHKNLELISKFKEYPQDIFNNFKLDKKIDKETINSNTSNFIKLSSITQIANK